MASGARLAAVLDSSPYRDGVYHRVSAVMGREDERFVSPELQRGAIERARAAAPGPSVVIWDDGDIDVSGGTMDRPKLTEALTLARAGGMDRLWVYSLDRWARTAADGLRELEAIEAAGCKVLSTVEHVDLDSPEGYFSATLWLALAEMKRRQIQRGWERVHQHRAEQGLKHGRPPSGYMLPAGARVMVPDPDQAPAVRQVLVMFADGAPVGEIIAQYRIATASTRRWVTDLRRVWRIAGNPHYAGKVVLNGQIGDGVHEPLIDPDTTARVQVRLDAARRGRRGGRNPAGGYPMSGLLVCAGCEGPVYYHQQGEPRGPRLLCGNGPSMGSGPKKCKGCGRPYGEDVEQIVVRHVVTWARRIVDDPGAAAEADASRAVTAARTGQLSRDLERVRRARASLLADRHRSGVPAQVWQAADEELATEEGTLLAALVDARAAATGPPIRRVAEMSKWLAGTWPSMIVGEKQHGLHLCVRHISVSASRFWREPVEWRVQVTMLDGAVMADEALW